MFFATTFPMLPDVSLPITNGSVCMVDGTVRDGDIFGRTIHTQSIRIFAGFHHKSVISDIV